MAGSAGLQATCSLPRLIHPGLTPAPLRVANPVHLMAYTSRYASDQAQTPESWTHARLLWLTPHSVAPYIWPTVLTRQS